MLLSHVGSVFGESHWNSFANPSRRQKDREPKTGTESHTENVVLCYQASLGTVSGSFKHDFKLLDCDFSYTFMHNFLIYALIFCLSLTEKFSSVL